MKKQVLDVMSIVDAVDNLTNMADLDVATLQQFKQSIQEGKEVYFFSKWLDLRSDETTIENIKTTFRVIHEYLKDSAKKDKDKVKDDKTQKGIRAMMVLAEEAANKIDRWTSLFANKTVERSVKEFKEYQDLKEFYHKKLLKKIRSKDEEKDLWLDSIEEELNLSATLEEKGLKDLQTVKEDKEYELFLIKKEDGKPFFNRNLLRHIKLVHDFDAVLIGDFFDDPFLQMQKIREKVSWESAKVIKDKIEPELKQFLKAHPYLKNSEFYIKLTQAFYALTLATSSSNLSEKKAKKGCDQYFADFCYLLCDSYVSSDYRALAGLYFEQMNQLMRELMLFGYKLCHELFYNASPKAPVIGLINQLMARIGKGEKEKFVEPSQMWTSFLEGNQHLRNVLSKYPNGPLFKLLDHFTLSEDSSFEPLMQQHYPQRLYRIENQYINLDVLKLPSPTRQELINKAESSLLFESYVRAQSILNSQSKLFLLNLQDRTSWQDAARCQLIESLPSKAEYKQLVQVSTLAKDTSFYYQDEEYLTMHNAGDFTKLLVEQILSAGECGFYLVADVEPEELKKFSVQCVELIHLHFFGSKETLSRKNRRDFIEIFYNFLILKLLDVKKPTECLLSCKDGIDTSSATSAGLFGFLKMFSEDNIWSREDADFYLWMMQSSALLIRERAIFQDRFERITQALMIVHAELDLNKKTIVKDFEKLYGYPIFKTLSVKEIKD